MSKRGGWPCYHQSPDLTVCDFFSLVVLEKHKICSEEHHQPPRNLEKLGEATITAYNNLELQMVRKTLQLHTFTGQVLCLCCRTCIL